MDARELHEHFRSLAGKTISKEFLISEYLVDSKNKKLLELSGSKFSNDVLAMFDISKSNEIAGKTIVLDLYKGVFISNKTSKRLINDFVREENILDFQVIRAIMRLLHISKGIPFVSGIHTMIALGGSVHENSDWMAINWAKQHRVKKQKAIFETNLNLNLEFTFKGKNLTRKIHDTAAINRCLMNSISEIITMIGFELKVKNSLGLLKEFEHCYCRICSDSKKISARQIYTKTQKLTIEKIYSHPDFELDDKFKFDYLCAWYKYLSYIKLLW